MFKYDQLKVEQLKKELAKLNETTAGYKAELQLRLRNALTEHGVDIEIMDFEMEDVCPDQVAQDQQSSEAPVTTAALDLQQLILLLEQLDKKNEQRLSDIDKKNEQRLGQMEKKNEERSQQNLKNVQSLAESLKIKANNVEQGVQRNSNRIDELEVKTAGTDHKVSQLEQTVCKLSVGPLTAIGTTGPSFKTPTFDGTTSFAVFKLQFGTTAQSNRWCEEDRASALIISLKGPAADILQTLPQEAKCNYEAIMQALHRQYSNDHMKQVHRLELKARCQQKAETLQAFAANIDRLAQLASVDASPDFIERSKIEAFEDGTRDPENKRTTMDAAKPSFAEAVSTALSHEAATIAATIALTIKVPTVK